jgi:hypothetical protein
MDIGEHPCPFQILYLCQLLDTWAKCSAVM